MTWKTPLILWLAAFVSVRSFAQEIPLVYDVEYTGANFPKLRRLESSPRRDYARDGSYARQSVDGGRWVAYNISTGGHRLATVATRAVATRAGSRLGDENRRTPIVYNEGWRS